VVQNPAITNYLYAGTNMGVYRSTDTGQTWKQVGLAGQTVYALMAPVFYPDMVVAGTTAGPQFSTNDGVTWTLENSGMDNPEIWSLAAGAASDKSLYFGTSYNGIYRFYNP